jgi:protein-S-isoprenylcysteine O-methyltransferase Ste14
MNELRDTPGVIAPPPLIALTTLLFGLALDWFLPSFILRGIFGFGARLVIAVIFIVPGMAMAIVAWRSFVQAGTNVEPWKSSLKLVTGGIFAWMRNPMYVGLIMLLAGLAIALGSDWALVLVLPAVLILHFGVVKREERYLAAKFGEADHGVELSSDAVMIASGGFEPIEELTRLIVPVTNGTVRY